MLLLSVLFHGEKLKKFQLQFNQKNQLMNTIFRCLPVRQMATLPIVVVLGATGTGKSKLAISLARKFNGEVINADSMQVYRGLDIITNKISPTEQMGCPHHLLGFLDPLKRFTVVDFRNRCLPIIDSLKSQGKMPVLVGGTHYYIESVLWNVLMGQSSEGGRDLLYDRDDDLTLNQVVEEPQDFIDGYSRGDLLNPQSNLANVSSSKLHKLLQQMDPETANIVHPNDKRKIMRSLQVYAQHNQKHSSLLASQRALTGGNSLGGPLRFENVVLFWLQCDETVLEERLDARVDQMVAAGLIAELTQFHDNLPEVHPTYTQGIFQSIGFKEFHDYLLLSDAEKTAERGKKLLEKGIEDVKRRTQRYARKQIQWIQNRFLARTDRQLPPIFALNASELDQWDTLEALSASIVQSAVERQPFPVPPLEQQQKSVDIKTTNRCFSCDRVFVSLDQWKTHLSSYVHKRTVRSKGQKEKALATFEIRAKSLLVIPQPEENSPLQTSISPVAI